VNVLAKADFAPHRWVQSRTAKAAEAICWQVMIELVLRLREMLNPEGGRPSYLLDGSSLELEATPSCVRHTHQEKTSMDGPLASAADRRIT